MRCILFFLVFFLTHNFCFSQNRVIDSLTTSFHNLTKNNSDDDTSCVLTLNDLSWEYLGIGDFTNSIKYANEAILFSGKITKAKNAIKSKFIANSYYILGVINHSKGSYNEAQEAYLKSLEFWKDAGIKKGVATCNSNIGLIYFDKGNHAKALEYHFKALKIREETNNKHGIIDSYNNIGNIFDEKKDYQKALDYYNKALNLASQEDDEQGIATSYSSIGLVYLSLRDYDKALDYNFKSLKIHIEIGHKQGEATSYTNIGNIYYLQNRNDESLEFYLKALKIYEEETGDQAGMTITYNSIGNLYLQMKKPLESKNNQLKSLSIAKEIGTLPDMMNAYLGMSKADSVMGNFKEAYDNHKMYTIIKDSIFNQETNKKSVQAEMNFEFEKKEQQDKLEQEKKDALAVEELSKQRLQRNGFIIGFGLMLVLALVSYRNYRNKKKSHAVIEHQKELVEEKNKEILDSINYAERIQRSFIATKELLDENLSDYFIIFKPKDVVSGDFYWAAKLLNGNFALVTADSTGHGVPGAIMSLLNVTSLEKAIEQLIQPSEIFDSTRRTIISRLKKDGSIEGGKDGMDASITVYDFKNKKIIVSAANNPVWIVRGKETIEIKPDKMPIGKHDKQDIPFSQQEFDLEIGDVIYTLTDGFPDQFGGEKGKKFMIKNLRQLINDNAHLAMEEQKQILETAFANWVGNLEQVDDVTLIGIRV